jgi:TP901 family phage tail tape measure protein
MRVRGGKSSAAELRKVRKEAEELGIKGAQSLANFASKADSVKSFGKKLMTYATVPIALMGAGAVTAAMDWESAFAGVRKTVDATGPQLRSLETDIRKMSTEVPVSATELAGLAEAAGQLGIETKNMRGFVRTMADLGVATNLSGPEAAEQLAQFANITKMNQADFDRLGSTIVALGNKTASTESQIVNMGMRIAGAGATVGMSEAEIMSFAAGLASVGVEAEAGGTAISTAFLKMNSAVKGGGDQLDKFATVAGMSGDEFKKRFAEDSAGAMIAFMEGLKGIDKDGGDVAGTLKEVGLGGIRATDIMLRSANAGELMRNALEIGNDAWSSNTALTKEAEERYKTFESRWIKFKNQVFDVAITIGTALLPVLSDLMAEGVKLIDWLKSADPLTQKLIIGAVLFTAALGPLAYAIGLVMSAGTTYLKVAIAMHKGMTALRYSTAAARVQLVWLATQQKAAAALGAIRAAAVATSNAFTVAGARAALLRIALFRFAMTARIAAIATGLMTAAQWLLNVALTANPIGIVIVAVVALVAAFVYAYTRFEWFRNFINRFWPYILAAFTGGLGLLVVYVIRNFDKIIGFLKGIPGKIASVASGMFDGIKNAFRSAINWIIGKWNGLELSLGPVKLPGPVPDIPKVSFGTPDIPMLAQGGVVSGTGSWISGEVPGVAELSTLMPNGSVKVEPLPMGGAAAAGAGGGQQVVEHRWFFAGREVTDAVGHELRVREANG